MKVKQYSFHAILQLFKNEFPILKHLMSWNVRFDILLNVICFYACHWEAMDVLCVPITISVFF